MVKSWKISFSRILLKLLNINSSLEICKLLSHIISLMLDKDQTVDQNKFWHIFYFGTNILTKKMQNFVFVEIEISVSFMSALILIVNSIVIVLFSYFLYLKY